MKARQLWTTVVGPLLATCVATFLIEKIFDFAEQKLNSPFDFVDNICSFVSNSLKITTPLFKTCQRTELIKVPVISTRNQVNVGVKVMALKKNQQSSKQMAVENHDILKKGRQSSVLPLTTQRRALNEIGNVVRHVHASICVEISKENSKTASKPQVRRSARLSVAQQNANQPRKVTRMIAKPKEAPVNNGRSTARPQSQLRVMGPPAAVPAISDRSELTSGPPKRKSATVQVLHDSRCSTRAPRLTMKPPPVETPPEERMAAQNLIRQSLAAERNRRFTMAVTAETQPVPITQIILQAISKTNAEKKEAPEIPSKYDIDLAHRRCFWMVSTYSKQMYAYLQRLDQKMASKIAQQQLRSVTETTRTKLVEWMASAYLQLHLLQETFQLSVSILDRYLLRVTDIKETRCELVAVTCLSLGIKYEELLTSLVKELLSLSSRPYTMKEFIEMEADVIRELGFQVARPIPLVFLRRYNTAAKCDRIQHSYGKYLIDLAQLDLNLARLPASSLASAAAFIGLTLKALQVDPEAWSPVMVHYTTLTFDDIRPVVSRMAMLALPGGPQCRYLRRKYAAEVSYLSTDRVQHLLLALHDLSFA